MAPGQTMIQQHTSIPGINAPQMQPRIQQQAQQPIRSNLTGLNRMNRPPPINMMQQGNMQQGNMQQSSMLQGNMQQTQQSMPLQKMPSLPQSTPPSQVARIALANQQQGINHAPMLVTPPRSGEPLRAALGPGRPAGPAQGTSPVGPGEARHMGFGSPQIDSYHTSNNRNQPPMQQNSGSHYPPASGFFVHRQPGFNQGGPRIRNRPPRSSRRGGGGGPIRHPRGRSQRNYYN